MRLSYVGRSLYSYKLSSGLRFAEREFMAAGSVATLWSQSSTFLSALLLLVLKILVATFSGPSVDLNYAKLCGEKSHVSSIYVMRSGQLPSHFPISRPNVWSNGVLSIIMFHQPRSIMSPHDMKRWDSNSTAFRLLALPPRLAQPSALTALIDLPDPKHA